MLQEPAKTAALQAFEQQPKPFLKWVGGKRSVLHHLHAHRPTFITKYYEPFLGGGAFYFSLKAEGVRLNSAGLSDVNLNLIATYVAVRDELDAVIDHLKKLRSGHSKEQFLDIRKSFSSHHPRALRAAYMIYLNKTCFNGLYRVNKSGAFNVPIGSYENPKILDEPALSAASSALQDTEIVYRSALSVPIEKGAFYYLDPPYHKTYSSYDSSGFGDAEHTKLAAFCKKIDSIGSIFLLSNSDTPFVRELYKGFYIHEIMAGRAVSCKGDGRGKTQELLISNYKRD